MTTPAPAELVHQVAVAPFGGDIVCAADIDGDGQTELPILQAIGQMQSSAYSRSDVDARDRRLFCLTAVRPSGEVAWQVGTPWPTPETPFTHHGGSGQMAVDDLDLDGRLEVIAVRMNELLVLDAATGATKRTTLLPADNFVRLACAQLGDPRAGRQIICKVNDRAFPPWDYANPVIIYNAELSIYHEPFAAPGSGHNLVAMDIDGDGRDEIFIGYSLFDHDIATLWTVDLGPGCNYAQHHADHIDVADINGDGRLEICYSGSEDFLVADLPGRVLWTATAGHSQYSVAGPWGPQQEMRIIMSEKNRGIWGFDAQGHILWHRTDINGYTRKGVRWSRAGGRGNWPIFRPQLRPASQAPYESDPAWSRGLWPTFMDGDGTLHEVFPWEESYTQPKRCLRAKRSYDNGVRYDVLS